MYHSKWPGAAVYVVVLYMPSVLLHVYVMSLSLTPMTRPSITLQLTFVGSNHKHAACTAHQAVES